MVVVVEIPEHPAVAFAGSSLFLIWVLLGECYSRFALAGSVLVEGEEVGVGGTVVELVVGMDFDRCLADTCAAVVAASVAGVRHNWVASVRSAGA